jgi:hypothetical protein
MSLYANAIYSLGNLKWELNTVRNL